MADIHKVYRLFMARFRPRRMRAMARYFNITPDTTVLDVGGALYNWTLIDVRPRLTIVNLDDNHALDGVQFVKADARKLPFADQSFDLVFSNSLLEHVGDFNDQLAAAREVRRVGRSYYVQTPNYWFPIEPHHLAPFIHWLPRWMHRHLARNFTLQGWINRPSQEQVAQMIGDIRLLTTREMKKLFPDADFINERFCGLVKSLIVVNRPSRSGPTGSAPG